MILFLDSAELELARKFLDLPELEIVLKPNWGSQHPGFREDTHGELKNKMAHAYPFSDASISHTKNLGGFAFTRYDNHHVLQIGFDLEEIDRVTPEIAQRICATPEEYKSAPSPASLWVAKEAAYKCLKGPQQPQVISQIELTGWKIWAEPGAIQYETCCLKDPQKFNFSKIQGLLLQKKPHICALFVARP